MPTEQLSGAVQSQLAEVSYRVEVVSGPDRGKEAEFSAELTVGTSPQAGLVLTDSAVSREHLRLAVTPRGATVRDLGSTNGTLLADIRTEGFLVREKVSFRIGRSVLRVARKQSVDVPLDSFGEAVTTNEAMRRVFSALRQAARGSVPILLQGETGTGKEILARAVHDASPRRSGSLVVVDCGSLSSDVIEAELFGHLKGSFTGAATDRPGLLIQSDGGTLFLDEVGELPLALQSRLLRFLVDGQVRPVGGSTAKAVDTRVLSATHRDLRTMVQEGRFRADLYYRLAGLVVEIPPLRSRPEDLELTFQRLLEREGRSDFLPPPELLAHLHSHSWPGNVRELKNFVQRLLSGTIEISAPSDPAQPFKPAKDALIEAFTRQYFLMLHDRCRGNVSEMARVSGLARPWVHEVLRRLKIRENAKDESESIG
jgi:DNA-binding NtrC family response regulator